MIEVRNLTKRYGELIAIRDVSFSVARGEILGFLGPNGAGKTTTMRILTGYMPASAGTATVDGFDVFEDSFEVRRRIGYLPETPPLYTDMTVESYLDFVARIKGVARAQIGEATDRAVAICGLGDVRHRLAGHLSKGYRQRVGLAQALIHDPPVLVLDEPTIGLDPRQIIEIRKLIRTLAGDRTVILSTHILPEVSQICEKVVILAGGRIALEDRMEALMKQGVSLEDVFLRAISKEEEHLEEAEETPQAPAPAAAGGFVKNALAIAAREIRSYFVSPVAYVVLTGFLLLSGWFFFNLLARFSYLLQIYSGLQRGGQELERLNLNEFVISPLLHNLSVVLVILIPMISMRTFAEEKRLGTFELLLTSPLRVGEIVAGKFLGALAFVTLMLALTGIYPILLLIYGNPEGGIMLAGYLGLFLVAASFLSIGLLTSSLTENQIVAAVSCLVALLLLYVINWPADTSTPTIGAVLHYLSVTEHFSEFVKGVIDTRALTYFVSLIAAALFLTHRSVESLRWR